VQTNSKLVIYQPKITTSFTPEESQGYLIPDLSFNSFLAFLLVSPISVHPKVRFPSTLDSCQLKSSISFNVIKKTGSKICQKLVEGQSQIVFSII
jgi:hypothetical protein